MSKIDALNQQFVCRVCRMLNSYNAGLYDEKSALKIINEMRHDYLDSMINIMEEKIDG